MKNFGTALVILGILLSIFTVAGCENEEGRKSPLDFINNWGEEAGWAIRIGMIVIGFVLISAADKSKKV